MLKGVIPVGDDACRFDYQKLENVLKNVIKRKLNDENAIMATAIGDSPTVPTFVVATKALRAESVPTLFRSYRCRGHNSSKCSIWQAARATSAEPTFFKPIDIDVPPPGDTYVDGGLTYNNPAELALSEATKLWPERTKVCLVSIGTGMLRSVPVVELQTSASICGGGGSKLWGIPGARTVSNLLPGALAVKRMAEACVQLATNSEPAHQRVFRLAFSPDPQKRFQYHRFNVSRDMHNIGLEEWHKMREMGAHTAAYLGEGEGEIKRDECVRDLLQPSISN